MATTDVDVDFVWDSANANINLRPGSLSSITIPSIGAGQCEDAYFEVEVTKDAAAFDTTRRYHITATDTSGSVSTPMPRELYVEHLVSQSRNAVTSISYGPDADNLTPVPAGGSMSLVVGNTYAIQLAGGTATQGYNQLEAFINFLNSIFQILDVETTYSANNSPYVEGPAPAVHDQLYADACLWENDPNSPNYRSCVGGDYKAGGSDVVTTYTILVVSGGGTSESLSSLLYDFSGSSFHYNADYAVGARIANIVDPATSTISKSFSPNPAGVNGISVLTFTVTNPNGGAISGYNFVDNLPANLQIAATPAASTSGCGAATLTANAGASSISFSDGTVAANSNCVITVNVTPTATGTLTNTSGNLFIDSLDTGDNATASLTVQTDTPGTGGFCQTLAVWYFPTGFSTTSPAPSSSTVTASAAPGAGIASQTSTADNTVSPAGTGSWRSNGSIATGTPLSTANDDYFQFAIDTTGLSAVRVSFDAYRTNNGAKGLALYYGTSATPPGTLAEAFGDTALTYRLRRQGDRDLSGPDHRWRLRQLLRRRRVDHLLGHLHGGGSRRHQRLGDQHGFGHGRRDRVWRRLGHGGLGRFRGRPRHREDRLQDHGGQGSVAGLHVDRYQQRTRHGDGRGRHRSAAQRLRAPLGRNFPGQLLGHHDRRL